VIISTNAIVLKTIPYGDTSIICRLFTEKHGKISVIAKGAWGKKKTAGVMLEPMKHIHVQYYNKKTRDIQILKNIELIHQFFYLRSRFNRIIIGQTVIELLDKSTPNNNALPVLYKLVWRVLEKLNDPSTNYWFIFAFYFYQLTLRLGFMPNLQSCCQCEQKLTHAFIDNRVGELICQNCFSDGKLLLDKNSLIFLQKLATMHLDDNIKTINRPVELYNAIHFLKKFAGIHIEGMQRVQSLDLMQKLCN